MKERYPYRTADGSLYGQLKELARQNRNNQTEAESILWSLIRGNRLGCPFKRQHVIGNFIADFVCLNFMLVVEIDGGYHRKETQLTSDNERTIQLNRMGFKVIRFTNEAVIGDTENVLRQIKENLK